jgi:putative AlgH/UPF0301 family transcriptional regulator
MNTEQRNTDQNSSLQHWLVTSPHVRGTPYDRRVIFLVEHSQRRSVGLLVDDAFQQSMKRLDRGSSYSERSGQRPSHRLAVPVDIVVWGPGQLQAEMEQGVWLTAQADLQEILRPHDDLWVDMLRIIGQSVLRDACGIADFAANPHLN